MLPLHLRTPLLHRSSQHVQLRHAPLFRYQSTYKSPMSYFHDFVARVKAIPGPVKGIIAANSIIFGVYTAYAPENARLRRFAKEHLTLTRSNIHRGRYDSIIGSMFMHTGLIHLGFNMYTLYSFAPLALACLSPLQFMGLYLGTGTMGAAAQLAYQGWAPRAGTWPAPASRPRRRSPGPRPRPGT